MSTQLPPEPAQQSFKPDETVTRPLNAIVRHRAVDPPTSPAKALPKMEDKDISTASTNSPETVECGGSSVQEKDLIRIAYLQARNKTYMAMPNMTEAGLMGMLHLGGQIDSLQRKAYELGRQSPGYDEVMHELIASFVKFGKVRKRINESKKLPRPLWNDIEKVRKAACAVLSFDSESKDRNWLIDHDVNDWARISVMTPTEHLVSRLPESGFGRWFCVPARLRRQNKDRHVDEYDQRIRQFFGVAAEILFIVLTWVFGSVPVIIKSLENPNKKLELLFYSLFFVFWSIVTSMLTSNFETRLYLNVGMAALYVQNIRAG